MMWFFKWLFLFVADSSARLVTVPTTPFQATNGTLLLSTLRNIIVDARYQNATDADGETLIPPTLGQFAQTFADDLINSCKLDLSVISDNVPRPGSVFLTLDHETSFLDAAGRSTSEGYSMAVTMNDITISGASPLGAWWGTRTLIQAIILQNDSLSVGSVVDAPGWATRGVMLDAGRHYYPPEFLIEMCSYLSFFKQNTFHLHLSDNSGSVYLDDYGFEMGLYAAFRLNSDDVAVVGLNRRKNESYTQDVFNNIQFECAARGVTILPEIEAPGHSLVITQWKPDIALSSDYSMLNISHPETLPTVKSIWKIFLPWFHSKTVHIGADEYDSDLVDDYNYFVNEMDSFIGQESGKSMRIWGTFPPSENYTNVYQNVSIQHWEFFEDNPYFDYIENGYDVLNSDDAFYIVNKWSGSYPQILNKTRIFHGDPAGGAYAPNIFDTSNSTNNPPRDHPSVLGHIAALWNDYGPNATVYSEAYYAWRDNLPALADKQWGGDLLEEEYESVFEKLHAVIPGQNLDRTIPSMSTTILKYDLSSVVSGSIRDTSGNGYHAQDHGCTVQNSTVYFDGSCYLETPLSSKGRNYSLSFSVKPASANPGTLFSGSDSSLLAGNGTITNVTLVASGYGFSLNYSLPVNTWTEVTLTGTGNQTFLEVGSGINVTSMEFITKIGINGNSFVWDSIAVEAPLKRIGEGFKGAIKDIILNG